MLERVLMPFWASGINDVCGNVNQSLITFFDAKKGYAIYDNINVTDFSVDLTDREAALKSYAADINRFGCASIESVNEISYNPLFPHSHAWKCVKSYYAAYYAAHSTLRMMGISCTNFDRNVLVSIEGVADLYGKKGLINIEKGYYKCLIDANKIKCLKINVAGVKGSHEQLWQVYLEWLNHVLHVLAGETPDPDIQTTILKLSDLKINLTNLGSNGGNWLAKVRNEITYRQSNGLWYPYKGAENYFKNLKPGLQQWAKAPETIDISIYIGKPILQFLTSCMFITSLNIALIKEMANRCSIGKSFHVNGALSFLNKIQVR